MSSDLTKHIKSLIDDLDDNFAGNIFFDVVPGDLIRIIKIQDILTACLQQSDPQSAKSRKSLKENDIGIVQIVKCWPESQENGAVCIFSNAQSFLAHDEIEIIEIACGSDSIDARRQKFKNKLVNKKIKNLLQQKFFNLNDSECSSS